MAICRHIAVAEDKATDFVARCESDSGVDAKPGSAADARGRVGTALARGVSHINPHASRW